MKITSNHLAQFLRAYAVVAFAACIPFLFQATDTANFISMFLVLVLMVVVFIVTSYIIKLNRKINDVSHDENLKVLDYLTVLYYELNLAECDLKEYGSMAGNEDWAAKQEKYIQHLKAEIKITVEKI